MDYTATMLIVELLYGYTETLVGRQRCIVDARAQFYFPGLELRPVPENKNVTFLIGPAKWLVLVWGLPRCCAAMEILLDEAVDNGGNAYVLKTHLSLETSGPTSGGGGGSGKGGPWFP